MLVKPLYGVECGLQRAFHPAGCVGYVIACENDATVNGRQRLVMRLPCALGPARPASQLPWDTMPADRDTVEKLLAILWVNFFTLAQCRLDALLGSHSGKV